MLPGRNSQRNTTVLRRETYRKFEVVICDNFVDPALSCERVCRESDIANLKYVRPPRPLGMVDNWNYALQFADGEYICYFTDKMFLLPSALTNANECVDQLNPDILTWGSNPYCPARYPDYFGEGNYLRGSDWAFWWLSA